MAVRPNAWPRAAALVRSFTSGLGTGRSRAASRQCRRGLSAPPSAAPSTQTHPAPHRAPPAACVRVQNSGASARAAHNASWWSALVGARPYRMRSPSAIWTFSTLPLFTAEMRLAIAPPTRKGGMGGREGKGMKRTKAGFDQIREYTRHENAKMEKKAIKRERREREGHREKKKKKKKESREKSRERRRAADEVLAPASRSLLGAFPPTSPLENAALIFFSVLLKRRTWRLKSGEHIPLFLEENAVRNLSFRVRAHAGGARDYGASGARFFFHVRMRTIEVNVEGRIATPFFFERIPLWCARRRATVVCAFSSARTRRNALEMREEIVNRLSCSDGC